MKDNKKNIVIVSHHYPPHISGLGMVAHNHALHLTSLGNQVTVITSDTNHDEKSRVMDGINVVRIKAWNKFEEWGAPFPIFSVKIIWELIKYIRMSDIVHIHDVFYISSFFAAVCARFYKKPLMLTQHVDMVMHPSKLVVFFEKIVYSTTGRITFKLCGLISTYNDRVEKFLLSKGIPKSKLFRLTNGVNTDIFHPVSVEEKRLLKNEFGISNNKKSILFAARFVPKKGFDKVYSAIDESYQIVFAGGDTTQESSDNAVFLGKLSQKMLSKVYQACDVFVLPSESEGFPLAIQEAMAVGLPIITTNDSGYDGYSLDRNLIELLDNPTNASVKDAIKKVVSDDSLRQKMSVYSKKYAEENFSWPISVDKLFEMYRTLIEKNRIRRKIAMVSDAVYEFNKGGKEKRIFDVSTRLVKEGFDVTIYCMKWWKGDKIFIKDEITYYAISPLYPLYFGERRSIKQAVFFATHCFKLINKKFDVMEVDHIPHLVLFVTRIVCTLRGKKMVATWHEVWGRKYWKMYLGSFFGFIAFQIEKISAKLPNTIISVSDHTTRNLKQILGIKNKIITIPNGLDIDMIKNQIASQNTSDVIFAGRLLSNKNVDFLIKAINLLKIDHRYLKVFIVGEGPEKENLEKLSKKLQLEKHVFFLGFLPSHNDLLQILKASKVFVLPSSREGFGISVIEANACGLPVVTVDVEHNAAKDLITNGENGEVCGLDETQIAEKIRVLLKNRKSPETYAEYSKKYNWNDLILKLKMVYV